MASEEGTPSVGRMKSVSFGGGVQEPPVGLLEGIKRVSSRKLNEKKKNWKAYCFTVVVLGALLARFFHLHQERSRLTNLIVARYEKEGKKDGKLVVAEVAQFLSDNGINVTKEQLNMWVGNIDDEDDGFDSDELAMTADLFQHFQTAKGEMKQFNHFHYSLVGDVALLLCGGIGLVWVLSSSEHLERRIAANSFVSAVRMSKLQRKWQDLEAQSSRYEKERSSLEASTGLLEEASREASTRALEYEGRFKAEQARSEASEESLRQATQERDRLAREAEEALQRLEKHKEEVESVRRKEASTEKELARLREEAEKHMQEAHMSTAKLRAMNQCLRGINAFGNQSPFKGAGEGKYAGKGATTGFAVEKNGSASESGAYRHGFKMQSFVFGYPTDNNVEMFEVDKSRDLLGEGADCAYRCRNIATNEQLALKIYNIVMMTHWRQILSDLHAHKETQEHPNIVKYKAVVETQEQIFVLMELIKGKDLFADIIDRHGLREKRAARIMLQLCDALKFLHSNNIIHGDIKPENVMLEKADTDAPFVKLIDFGFSCFLNKDTSDHSGNVGGMLEPVRDIYAPPEAFDQMSKKPVTYSLDSFRLGCCLYVMLMATYPFKENDGRDIEDRRAGNVLKYKAWQTLSADAQDLIVALIRDRITMDAVLEHPWLVKNAPARDVSAPAT